jgi:hypothetical protein
MDLENQIARLELRAEQLGIHLQDLPRNGSEAMHVRSKLYGMLQELTEQSACIRLPVRGVGRGGRSDIS